MIKKIIILVILWIIYIFADYFLLDYFVQPFVWLVVCGSLLILLIKQIIKTISQRKNLNAERIVNLSITLILFLLTFYNFNKIPNSLIEKIDWLISYDKRTQVVRAVEAGEISPNNDRKNGILQLSFSFPIVSNGGNEIWIEENKNESTKTIKFWISRGFFESPQTYFIYTSDIKIKEYFQKLIKEKPENNWQLEENWFRIMER